ncbi:MAG: EVE domain-containing protein [Acidobacteria bacterium]|nr:EVE domain-containing protein [Acidobacteriota bacterium]
MNWFLAKSEPDTYSIDDLQRDVRTAWDGVTNPQAVKVIRSMRPGDSVLIYHSGKESRIVGVARVLSEPRDDPKNPKSAVVDLEYSGRVAPPLPLSEVKASGEFGEWALVRQGRLSTMAVPEAFIAWMKASGRNVG